MLNRFPTRGHQIHHFDGISAAPDAGATGAEAAAGAEAACSRMLAPCDDAPRRLPKYANARVATKKIVAATAVERERKLALPVAPNRLPDEPLPVSPDKQP